jgi:predicted PurR-regulated permease PerM
LVIVPILGFFFLKDGGEMRQRFLEMIDDPTGAPCWTTCLPM